MLSANNAVFLKWSGISLIYTEKSSGDRHEPCGTPVQTGFAVDCLSSIFTLKLLFDRSDLIMFTN